MTDIPKLSPEKIRFLLSQFDLDAVKERAGKTTVFSPEDLAKLQKILPLFASENHTANQSACRKALFPDELDAVKSQPQFRAYCSRLKATFALTDSRLELVCERFSERRADSLRCWFEGQDDVEKSAEEFSSQAADHQLEAVMPGMALPFIPNSQGLRVHNLQDLASRPYTLSLIREYVKTIGSLERLELEGRKVQAVDFYDQLRNFGGKSRNPHFLGSKTAPPKIRVPGGFPLDQRG